MKPEKLCIWFTHICTHSFKKKNLWTQFNNDTLCLFLKPDPVKIIFLKALATRGGKTLCWKNTWGVPLWIGYHFKLIILVLNCVGKQDMANAVGYLGIFLTLAKNAKSADICCLHFPMPSSCICRFVEQNAKYFSNSHLTIQGWNTQTSWWFSTGCIKQKLRKPQEGIQHMKWESNQV